MVLYTLNMYKKLNNKTISAESKDFANIVEAKILNLFSIEREGVELRLVA